MRCLRSAADSILFVRKCGQVHDHHGYRLIGLIFHPPQQHIKAFYSFKGYRGLHFRPSSIHRSSSKSYTVGLKWYKDKGLRYAFQQFGSTTPPPSPRERASP